MTQHTHLSKYLTSIKQSFAAEMRWQNFVDQRWFPVECFRSYGWVEWHVEFLLIKAKLRGKPCRRFLKTFPDYCNILWLECWLLSVAISRHSQTHRLMPSNSLPRWVWATRINGKWTFPWYIEIDLIKQRKKLGELESDVGCLYGRRLGICSKKMINIIEHR